MAELLTTISNPIDISTRKAAGPSFSLGILRRLSQRIKQRLSLGIRSIPFEKLSRKYTHPDSRFIDIDGIRVHYCDQGQGPVILLLHGMLSSLHTWDEWAESLKAHYRIIRLDIPGFGLTGYFTSKKCHRDLYIKFLHRLVETLGLEKFDIAGNSLGG